MPKLFVISDIHGYYDEMIEALNNAGFDPNNQNHYLLGLGDYFDRGSKPAEVMHYLENLPRKILIKGNHEEMLMNCCNRGYFMPYDGANGTLDTILILGDATKDTLFLTCCRTVRSKVKPFLSNMMNYFETQNYIFVHSFVPIKTEWRNASDKEWDEARWGNPFKLRNEMKLDKTFVFGHWHCSAGWAEREERSEFGNDAKFDIFYGEDFISIDACTAHSGKCNVLVLEDEFISNDSMKDY